MSRENFEDRGPEADSRQELTGLIRAYTSVYLLRAAVQLDIADILAKGSKTAAELATAAGVPPSAMERLMAGLVEVGIFADDDGQLVLNSPSELLRRDHPASLRSMVLFHGAPYWQSAWAQLGDTIATGESGFKRAHGVSQWEYFETHPDAADEFNAYMVTLKHGQHEALVKAYDFSGIDTLVDVGGGRGGWITAIMQAHLEMKGTLFDQPALEQTAIEHLNAQGVKDRCGFVGGDFFKSVPKGADAYFLASVLHDWGDDDARAILNTCRRAMKPTSSLLLVEEIVSVGGAPRLIMMVAYGGDARDRTQAEFRQLLESSGFELKRVVGTENELSLLEARIK